MFPEEEQTFRAIIDGIENGSITNAKIDVVISNNKNAYALERAKKHDIEAVALSPKDFETRVYLTKHCITSL